MSPGISQNVEIEVGSPADLFSAPDVNPFSENRLEVLGMSGLEYIARQLQRHRRDWRHTRLHVRLPPDQITPGFKERLTAAVRRYCQAKIEDNKLEIHLIRFRSSIGLGILLVVVAAIIIGALALFTGPLAGAPQAVQVVIAATISLFGWVSLWDPLEALLFNPIPLLRENYILRKITEMDLVVEPSAGRETAGTALAITPDGARTTPES